MRSQHVGWDRLRGFLTGVGDYLRAGAGRPRQHNSFGGGCRGKTDHRCRGGHGEYSCEPSVDVLPGTDDTAVATSRTARLPAEHFGCHVHNFRKWTWQLLIPQAPGEPPHIPGPGSAKRRVPPAGRARCCRGGSPSSSCRSAAVAQCCSVATINSFVIHLY